MARRAASRAKARVDALRAQEAEEHALQRAVLEVLESRPEIDGSEIRVRVHDGVVCLSGAAPDVNTIRLAEELACAVPDIKRVMNDLRVRVPSEVPLGALERPGFLPG